MFAYMPEEGMRLCATMQLLEVELMTFGRAVNALHLKPSIQPYKMYNVLYGCYLMKLALVLIPANLMLTVFCKTYY